MACGDPQVSWSLDLSRLPPSCLEMSKEWTLHIQCPPWAPQYHPLKNLANLAEKNLSVWPQHVLSYHEKYSDWTAVVQLLKSILLFSYQTKRKGWVKSSLSTSCSNLSFRHIKIQSFTVSFDESAFPAGLSVSSLLEQVRPHHIEFCHLVAP